MNHYKQSYKLSVLMFLFLGTSFKLVIGFYNSLFKKDCSCILILDMTKNSGDALQQEKLKLCLGKKFPVAGL